MNDRAVEPNGSRQTAGQLVPAAQSIPATRDPYGPLAGYPGTVEDAPGNTFRSKLLEYWRIFNKRKWLILSIAAAFVALAAVRTLMQTPLYTSTVRLQIDQNVAKIVQGDNVMPIDDSDVAFMRTQYELLRGHTMAERVASSLKLGDDPDFLRPREFSLVRTLRQMLSASSPGDNAASEAARESTAAWIVSANVAVRPIAGSRLVDLDYYDPSPQRAQGIANAYADAFLASNIDKRFQANASAKIFLEDKIKQLKIRLEDSEKRQLTFAQEQQIDVSDKASIAENNLAAANAALGTLISERTKNEQLWRQTDATNAINLPQLLSNGIIEGLRSKRQQLELEYQQKSQIYKPAYPAMVQIKNQIDEIDRQLATEIQTVKASLKAAYESSLAQEEEMKKRVETLKQEVLDLQKRSIQYNTLKREVDTNRELYTSLLQRYKEVDVASGVGANNMFVVERAGLPGSPSSPQLFPALRLALILGLAAGFGLAYVLEMLDDKIRSVENLESISSLATLGVIPKISDVDLELADPRSALCEAYRSLCTALQFATENGLPKTLSITSSGPSEGKSLTAIAIAKHFATLGRKVLLVDADLRNPSLHVKLYSDNSVGLSNYLTGACSPPDVMQTTETPNLAFIASGPLPPNAADLLGSARLLSLLSIGSEVFDLIIVDGPPVMGLADAQLLSSATAATIFVVAAGISRKGNVNGALRRLQLSRALVIGAVLTQYDAKSAGYGYGYGYSYDYAYGSNRKSKEHGSEIVPKMPQLADLRERLANLRKSA